MNWPPPSPSPPPPSPSPPPPSPSPPLQTLEGVIVIPGNTAIPNGNSNGNLNQLEFVGEGECVHPSANKTASGDAIAAQCCHDDTCYRSQLGPDGDSVDCIAGIWNWNFEYTTWSEAKQRCELLGYTLCDQSCRHTGCGYDTIYVWTNTRCALPLAVFAAVSAA